MDRQAFTVNVKNNLAEVVLTTTKSDSQIQTNVSNTLNKGWATVGFRTYHARKHINRDKNILILLTERSKRTCQGIPVISYEVGGLL